MTFSLQWCMTTFSNMADNSGKVANMARIVAIVHIIVGFLLICFGIADRAVEYFWTGYVCYCIWTGVWMCIAGGLGISGSRKERSSSRNAFAGVFMGFFITSAVLGGIIIIFYSVAIAEYRNRYIRYEPVYEPHYNTNTSIWVCYHTNSYRRIRPENFDTDMALNAIILILGIVELAIGIWAAVCLCMMKPCTCCYDNPPQQGQAMHAPSGGYAMTQYPGGVPVAVPIQAGGSMVPVQSVTPGPQGGQPQMVVVPISGMVGNQPQFVQVVTSGAMTTAYQPQLPPTYEQGGYTKMENGEFSMNT